MPFTHNVNAVSVVVSLVLSFMYLPGAALYGQEHAGSSDSTVAHESNQNIGAENFTEVKSRDERSEGMRTYERSKLVVALGSGMLPRYPHRYSYHRSLSRRWIAFQGIRSIDEDEFFRIAGYLEEAEEAASYQRLNRILGWGGLGAMLLGGIMIYIQATTDIHTRSTALGTTGLALGTIGLPLAIIGGVRSSRNMAPFSSVHDIANQYKHELHVKLRL